MLKLVQRFGKYSNCHLQGECLLVGGFRKTCMEQAAMIFETMTDFERSMELAPEAKVVHRTPAEKT